MDNEAARYQKLEQLHERREEVVRLPLQGAGVMQIVALAGLRYPTVRKAIDLYAQGGWAAIKPTARERRAGEGRRLSAEQEARLRTPADEHVNFIAAPIPIAFAPTSTIRSSNTRRDDFMLADQSWVSHAE